MSLLSVFILMGNFYFRVLFFMVVVFIFFGFGEWFYLKVYFWFGGFIFIFLFGGMMFVFVFGVFVWLFIDIWIEFLFFIVFLIVLIVGFCVYIFLVFNKLLRRKLFRKLMVISFLEFD